MTIDAIERKESVSELLVPITGHWMKARIDAPMAAMDRLDQSAKQMVALAGGLQAVLTAVIKIAKVDEPVMLSLAAVSFIFLVATMGFSAMVLYRQQTYIGASSIVQLLKQSSPAAMIPIFAEQVERMCKDADRVLERKRVLLGRSLACFAISMTMSVGCVLVMIVMGSRDTASRNDPQRELPGVAQFAPAASGPSRSGR